MGVAGPIPRYSSVIMNDHDSLLVPCLRPARPMRATPQTSAAGCYVPYRIILPIGVAMGLFATWAVLASRVLEKPSVTFSAC